jgi:hypothetical protein
VSSAQLDMSSRRVQVWFQNSLLCHSEAFRTDSGRRAARAEARDRKKQCRPAEPVLAERVVVQQLVPHQNPFATLPGPRNVHAHLFQQQQVPLSRRKRVLLYLRLLSGAAVHLGALVPRSHAPGTPLARHTSVRQQSLLVELLQLVRVAFRLASAPKQEKQPDVLLRLQPQRALYVQRALSSDRVAHGQHAQIDWRPACAHGFLQPAARLFPHSRGRPAQLRPIDLVHLRRWKPAQPQVVLKRRSGKRHRWRRTSGRAIASCIFVTS